MSNILVTGGAGFIGANFVHYWRQTHPSDSLTILDALTYAGNPASLPANDTQITLVVGDICDAALVADTLRKYSIDLIVHFAAESHVDRSITGPEAFLQTNVMGTYTLLEAARHAGIRFHHISTDEVFGSLGPEDAAFQETTPYSPNSPYSASKAASDHLVRAYVHTYGLKATTSNCSNNYGPYHFPEKLIPLCITNILRGLPLPVYGDGLNVRDWLYVEDHCLGIDLVIQKGRVGETYNIGGNNEWKNIDLVRLLCTLIDEEFSANNSWATTYPDAPAARKQPSASLITFVTDRPGHDRRYAVDTSRARNELGYLPRHSFPEGIRKTVRWFLANQAWWEPLLKK
ncbi:MAG: dTDP-glucose 4,6-dehydratase [Terrimicrobiaceae bacterium]